MQNLNYIGSKKTLIPHILKVCEDNIPNDEYIFYDLFAGTSIVAQSFANKYQIVANDLEYYSYIISYANLKSCYSSKLKDIIATCNKLDVMDIKPNKDNLISLNYSPNEACDRMFFTPENAAKADIIRQYIETLYSTNQVNKKEYIFLIASLIISIDKLANTSSVYGAYLKKYKKTALKPLILKPVHTRLDNYKNNKVYNDYAENIQICDNAIVYLDPPYNHRQYGANYSPLNYIARYDKNIILNGKTGLISNYNKSDFCSKVKSKSAFKKLINNIKNSKYIILSYNNEGIIPFEFIKEVLSQIGSIKLYKIKYKKFKAQKTINNEWVYEYIWFVNTQISNDYEEIELPT